MSAERFEIPPLRPALVPPTQTTPRPADEADSQRRRRSRDGDSPPRRAPRRPPADPESGRHLDFETRGRDSTARAVGFRAPPRVDVNRYVERRIPTTSTDAVQDPALDATSYYGRSIATGTRSADMEDAALVVGAIGGGA